MECGVECGIGQVLPVLPVLPVLQVLQVLQLFANSREAEEGDEHREELQLVARLDRGGGVVGEPVDHRRDHARVDVPVPHNGALDQQRT